jgi:CheY-like chemotaxis protein
MSQRSSLSIDRCRRQNRRQLRVLIVDDSRLNRTLVLKLLEKNGHTSSVAANGEEALSILETEQFDLVLMDLEMPKLDGLTAASLIRQRERLTLCGRLPIVALTAGSGERDLMRCLEAGMDAQLTKPVTGISLNEVIWRVVQSSSTGFSL